MNNKLNYILLTLMLLILVTPAISARSFSVSSVDIYYNLNQNGLVNVSEKWDYQLTGCYKELYIQKPNELVIENPSGYCTGSTCEFIYKPTDTISGEKELILKGDYCDTSVVAYFNYNINNQIWGLVDGTQFYYKLYGENTEVPTKTNITLFLPGDVNQTTYFIHSEDYNLTNDKNILFITKDVIPNEIIEINLLMPKVWFEEDGLAWGDTNATIESVMQLEQDWKSGYDDYMAQTPVNKTKAVLIYLLKNIIFLLIVSLILFLCWFFYGREFKKEEVGYLGIYERDLPGDETPVQANYFINGNFSKDWFSSALLYLVWKKYYDIETRGKSVVLIKKKNTSKEVLPDYISDVYKLLTSTFSDEIDINELKSELTYNEGYMDLYNKTSSASSKWFKNGKFFEYKGVVIFGIIFGIAIFISFVFFFLSTLIMIIIFVIYSIKINKQDILFGRFTKEGRIRNLKWDAFKHYITDFSVMKEHPPASVIIWEQYMVYATAFGVAKEASKVIGQIMPQNVTTDAKFNSFSTFAMASTAISSIPSSRPSSSGGSGSHSGGGGGGFGGGGGGGGGGAR
ncbi:MAG: DUF2207 domain-containing protein [archaeon]